MNKIIYKWDGEEKDFPCIGKALAGGGGSLRNCETAQTDWNANHKKHLDKLEKERAPTGSRAPLS